MGYFRVSMGSILVKAAKLFHTAQGIADYLGVSLPTLYSWIERYHTLSFRQFKRKYICSNRTCIVVDHGATDYSWKYTMTDRIHGQAGCVCFIEGSSRLMMTTLSPLDAQQALQAEVANDQETGIYHLRYPIRLPVLQPGESSNTQSQILSGGHVRNPVIVTFGELYRHIIGTLVRYPVVLVPLEESIVSGNSW